MTEATMPSMPSTPRKRGRRLLLFVWVGATILVLLLIAYFVVTSSGFFKAVILPRAGKAMNAQISVEEALVNPFSQVVLRNLKVITTGADPLLSAQEVRVRYRLMDILRGNLNIAEVAFVSPSIVLVQNPDGSNNLDPILKSQKASAASAPASSAVSAKTSKPPRIDVRQVTITGATFRYVKAYPSGVRDVDEISNLNLALSGLGNGQTAKMTLEAGIAAQNNPPGSKTNSAIQAKFTSAFSVSLAEDLKPTSLNGNLHLEVLRAEGGFAQLAACGADLECDLRPTEIKQLSLRLQQAGAALGQVRVSGPFDPAKLEGRLLVELSSIDKRLLNLAGRSGGVDFGSTTVSSTNTIEVAKAGSTISFGGQFLMNRLQVTRDGQSSPVLDIHAAYDVTLDRAQSGALLRSLTLVAARQGNAMFQAQLSSPMSFAWGDAKGQVGDAALTVTLSGLDLAEWKPLMGGTAVAGTLGGQFRLLSKEGGKQLHYDLSSSLDNLTIDLGSNQLHQVSVGLQLTGAIANLKQFKVEAFGMKVAQRDQPLLAAGGSGTFDSSTANVDLQLSSQVFLDRLAQALQMTNAAINDPQKRISSTAMEVNCRLDMALHKKVLDLRQFQLNLTPTSRGANQVQLTGQLDISDPTALQGSLKLVADKLDLTSYYDQFCAGVAGGGKSSQGSAAGSSIPDKSSTATPPVGNPAQEPPSKQLPFRNFSLGLALAHLYLHEIEVADCQITTKIDGGHVVVDPFKLTLNRAPVSSKMELDMSVPGFKYDLALHVDAVPLAPFVNTFLPDRKGLLGGTMTGMATVTGAGVTGPGIQKNLSGKFDVTSTNLNLSVDNIQGKNFATSLLKFIVSTITVIPDLAKNPTSAGLSLVEGLTGFGSSANAAGGNSGADLKKSPIDSIILHSAVSGGRVSLQQAFIESPAFQIQATGTVTLASVLTNSTMQIPVALFLERGAAQRIHISGSTPADATYTRLPDFLTLDGTLGAPKREIDKAALASAVLQGIGGKSGQVGNLLKNLNLGGSGGVNPFSGTNSPAAGIGGLLQGLRGGLTSPASASSASNAPAEGIGGQLQNGRGAPTLPGNTPPKTSNPSPDEELFKDLFGPKK